MVVPIAFKIMLGRLQPLPSEVQHAVAHAATIRSRLLRPFRVRKFLLVGSHSRRSAIRRYSDIDYFVVVARDDIRWGGGYERSTTVLEKFRRDLASRFWQTDVRKDAQAITLSFGSGEYSVDVVPAIFWQMASDNWPVYLMPDGDGWWMATCPERHNRYIAEANLRSRGKLRATAQLIKFWRVCRTPRVSISSFHLELMLAAERVCEGAKSYAQCLTETFRLLVSRGCRAYRDPLGVSGNITACHTHIQQAQALEAAIYARLHAKSALDAEARGDNREACRQWGIVFNGSFPT